MGAERMFYPQLGLKYSMYTPASVVLWNPQIAHSLKLTDSLHKGELNLTEQKGKKKKFYAVDEIVWLKDKTQPAQILELDIDPANNVYRAKVAVMDRDGFDAEGKEKFKSTGEELKLNLWDFTKYRKRKQKADGQPSMIFKSDEIQPLFTGLDYAAEQVRDFQTAFDHPVSVTPHPLTPHRLTLRSGWTAEEVIERFNATADGDKELFDNMVNAFISSVYKASAKVEGDAQKQEFYKAGEVHYLSKIPNEFKEGANLNAILLSQIDGTMDGSYFLMGDCVEMGVRPQSFFSIVHEANMGKLFPDGKPRKVDGKTVKPENWERDFAPEPRLLKEMENQIAKSLGYKSVSIKLPMKGDSQNK